jgi:hypothetical protein
MDTHHDWKCPARRRRGPTCSSLLDGRAPFSGVLCPLSRRRERARQRTQSLPIYCSTIPRHKRSALSIPQPWSRFKQWRSRPCRSFLRKWRRRWWSDTTKAITRVDAYSPVKHIYCPLPQATRAYLRAYSLRNAWTETADREPQWNHQKQGSGQIRLVDPARKSRTVL